MHPVMLQIGPLAIRWYGALIVAAIFVGFYLAERYLKRQGFDIELFERATFFAVIWGVVGARLVYVITSPSEFELDPISMLYVWHGGLSFFGGIVGGLVVFFYYTWRYRAPFYAFVEATLPGVSLGIIAGRLGNIMNGSDTSGRLTNFNLFPLTINWPSWASGYPGYCTSSHQLAWDFCTGSVVRGPVWFTQLFGVVIGLVLLLLVFRWLSARQFGGYAFWNFVLWYSVLRSVFEEPFRLNPLWWPLYNNIHFGFGLLTATQLVSIPLVILAIYMLRRGRRISISTALTAGKDSGGAVPWKKGRP